MFISHCGRLTKPQVGLTVVVTVFSEVIQQSLRASMAVGSGARAVRSLRMLPTGTRVPVTRGESGKLTIGHVLVAVTVLILLENPRYMRKS